VKTPCFIFSHNGIQKFFFLCVAREKLQRGTHPFRFVTERTPHLAGLWIGAAISNTSHSNKALLPLSNEHRSQVKDQCRRQCYHNKQKKFPIALHVMYLYFPDTARRKLEGKRHVCRKAWKKMIQGASAGGLSVLHRSDVLVPALLQLIDFESFNSLRTKHYVSKTRSGPFLQAKNVMKIHSGRPHTLSYSQLVGLSLRTATDPLPETQPLLITIHYGTRILTRDDGTISRNK
jgi:hypothetical protein